MSRVLYIDYENVQDLDLGPIAQMDLKVWLFAGTSQNKIPIGLVRSTQALGNRLEWVSIDGNGPNALDFHIAYYLGVHAGRSPKDEYVILSKDKGFDPLIKHVVKNKVKCRRITTISEMQPSARAASARVKKATDADAVYTKVVNNLTKIEDSKRPRNLRALRGHIKTLIGKSKTEQNVEQIISRLRAAKAIVEVGGGLEYHL